MQNSEKETYKDYLVRKVTEEISNVFKQKMDETKKGETGISGSF